MEWALFVGMFQDFERGKNVRWLTDIRLILEAASTQLYDINDDEDKWDKIKNKIKFGSLQFSSVHILE